MSRTVRLTLAVATGLALIATAAPATAAPAGAAVPGSAAATAAATWDLSDYEQRACIPANTEWFTYFIGFVAGSWTTPLQVDVQGLPAGTVTSLPHPPIAPADNGDRYLGIAWVTTDLPPLAYGEYRAVMTLTDGSSTQSMPIVIKAQERWGC
ncbi:DUF5980 family protein [Micromonospora sp. NBC_01813]|uniref:DUF5980 family protein n=1 Tax=Micromonospora sp. NBC_01813 TaxID=2975988 RepID=UPI002DDA9A07|nr:DUF5980 family protein [Micromonospora sp. NBC_01813]WSA12619.1 DUF5980 family protein [Micromonospora sp. NBC_01813]